MDLEKKKKLVERIAKLFRLGDANRNENEYEVMLAATRARQLMAEHDISMMDLNLLGDSKQAEEIRFNIIRATAYVRRAHAFAVYDSWIAVAVDAICGTKNLVSRIHDGRSVFVQREFAGTEADTAVACALFHVLLSTARKMARNVYGSKWTNSHTSYMEGLGCRIAERAKAANEPIYRAEHGQALMVIDRKKANAITSFFESVGIRHGRTLKSQTKDFRAYYQGYNDGATVDFAAKRRVAENHG